MDAFNTFVGRDYETFDARKKYRKKYVKKTIDINKTFNLNIKNHPRR